MKTKAVKFFFTFFFAVPFTFSVLINMTTAYATVDIPSSLNETELSSYTLSEYIKASHEPSLPDVLSDSSVTVNVYVKASDEVVPISLHDYLISAVAGEMPATFELEALKAQAVAARTFVYSHLNSSCSSNRNAHVCTYYGCCQAYVSTSQMKKNWGSQFEAKYAKIKQAVEETDGIGMYYNEKPITVFYFSASNGYTDACQDVFVKTLPYYQSVESPGEETVSVFYTTVRLTYDEFLQTLSSKLNISVSKEDLLSQTTFERTPGNRVSYVSFSGKKVKGTQFRSAFSLRSADFHFTFLDDYIIIEVYGNGHGCGMSQYGANYMAKCGSTYKEILSHYYIGVEIR